MVGCRLRHVLRHGVQAATECSHAPTSRVGSRQGSAWAAGAPVPAGHWGRGGEARYGWPHRGTLQGWLILSARVLQDAFHTLAAPEALMACIPLAPKAIVTHGSIAAPAERNRSTKRLRGRSQLHGK